jgi:hypothetical protein
MVIDAFPIVPDIVLFNSMLGPKDLSGIHIGDWR